MRLLIAALLAAGLTAGSTHQAHAVTCWKQNQFGKWGVVNCANGDFTRTDACRYQPYGVKVTVAPGIVKVCTGNPPKQAAVR